MSSRYQEALDFLYFHLPIYSDIGIRAYKPKLDNILALSSYFENPHEKLKAIHIGGTNGKGSTTHFLASIFIEKGMRVGIYSSPHIRDFKERIKINNEYIDESYVVDFVDKAKDVITVLNPSFFEMSVIMAFKYFVDKEVDIAVIEVGLGGRLDSTNILKPILSAVTNVSMDHMDILGDSMEEIAQNKAGIIKENTPFILGLSNIKYDNIFEQKAAHHHTQVIYAEREIDIVRQSQVWSFHSVGNRHIDFSVKSDLFPIYQSYNIRTATSIYDTLFPDEEFNKKNTLIKHGIENMISNTHLIGRWQKEVIDSRHILFDSSHNVAGIEQAVEALKQEKYDKLLVVLGVMGEKDIKSISSYLPRENARYYLTQAASKRALDVNNLHEILKEEGMEIAAYNKDYKHIFKQAVQDSTEEDLIFVTGSMYLIGDILNTFA